MMRLTDSALDEINKDSVQCIAPRMGDVQLMVSEIRRLKAEIDALGKDAERFRWLNRQRSSEWKILAEMPMNHTAGYIDAALHGENQS